MDVQGIVRVRPNASAAPRHAAARPRGQLIITAQFSPPGQRRRTNGPTSGGGIWRQTLARTLVASSLLFPARIIRTAFDTRAQ